MLLMADVSDLRFLLFLYHSVVKYRRAWILDPKK